MICTKVYLYLFGGLWIWLLLFMHYDMFVIIQDLLSNCGMFFW